MPRSPLFEKLKAAQAQFFDYQGWEIPSSFGSVEAEYWALKKGVGLLDLSYRGRLLVCGEDAPRFLHGMVTNEIKGLEVGRGNYAFVLDVHGHILAEARIFRLHAESYLIECEPQLTAVIREALDRHIISDVVELEDASASQGCLALEGPCAREVVREALRFDPSKMPSLEHLEIQDLPACGERSQTARLACAALSGEKGYWIFASPELLGGLWKKALEAGTPLGLWPVGFEALEICRLEAGIPRYGCDMDTKTLPQETGQMQAISFTKGCYIGQEVVERIRSRGHVNRRLVGLLLEGEPKVPRDAMILAGGHPVGSITSSAYSYGLRRTIALGYLRREYAEPGTAVVVENSSAEVAALPFLPPSPGVNPGSPSS